MMNNLEWSVPGVEERIKPYVIQAYPVLFPAINCIFFELLDTKNVFKLCAQYFDIF